MGRGGGVRGEAEARCPQKCTSKRGKTHGDSYLVMAGLVPAIPIVWALSFPDRDRRDKPGDDELAATSFVPVTFAMPSVSLRAGEITGNFRRFLHFTAHLISRRVNSCS